MSKNPIEEGVETLSQSCCECLETYEEQIRKEPWLHVLAAAAIGYLLHLLPVCKIANVFLRVLLSLAKPVLLAWGVLKLVSYLSEKKNS